VSYNVHGLCDSPKHCRTIADPANGCSLWVEKQGFEGSELPAEIRSPIPARQ
jgi:hypothetical protein